MKPVPTSTKYDYQGKCWWCGDNADSREHKWKKSELVALYGAPDSGNYPLTWFDGDGITKLIQGPNSALVKFEKSLCQNCNNAKSQRFDLAYDLWVEYITANYDQIIDLGFVNLCDIIESPEVEEFRANLARYFAKHSCCRLADGGAAKVPESAVAFLNGENEDSGFAWTELCLSRSALESREMSRLGLGMSETVSDFLRDGTALTSLRGALSHGAIQFVWDINLDPNRSDNGNGILARDAYLLRAIDDDLYHHSFTTFFGDGV